MNPQTVIRNPALYRAQLACKIARDCLDGKSNPPLGCSLDNWVMYQLLHAVEDIAKALEEKEGK